MDTRKEETKKLMVNAVGNKHEMTFNFNDMDKWHIQELLRIVKGKEINLKHLLTIFLYDDAAK